MTILQALEAAFISWLTRLIANIIEDSKIMVSIADVRARIAELEDEIEAERGQVTAAIDALTAKVKEALQAQVDSADEMGEDFVELEGLAILIEDLDRVSDEIKAIYEPKLAPMPEATPLA